MTAEAFQRTGYADRDDVLARAEDVTSELRELMRAFQRMGDAAAAREISYAIANVIEAVTK